MTTELISSAALADYLEVPLKTLYAWRHRGVGPRGIKVGKHVRYRREDVERWLEDHADDRTPNAAA